MRSTVGDDDVAEGSRSLRWGLADAAAGYLVAIFGSSLVAAVVLSVRGGAELGLGGLALAQVALWAGFLGAPLVATHRRGTASLRRDFGLWARPRDALVGIPVGIAAQFVLVPLIYVPFRALFDVDDLSRPARELVDRASGAELVVLAAALIVVAPIIEELFFRGLLLRAWERRASTVWAVTGSAVVFGVTHFELLQLPALAAVGGVFALLAVQARRLGPAIWAHAAFNAATVAALVLGR
jgi:membrane protease YdiL (CAAX protease family)